MLSPRCRDRFLIALFLAGVLLYLVASSALAAALGIGGTP